MCRLVNILINITECQFVMSKKTSNRKDFPQIFDTLVDNHDNQVPGYDA